MRPVVIGNNRNDSAHGRERALRSYLTPTSCSCILRVVIFAVVCTSVPWHAYGWQSPTGRLTTDRHADLINACIEAGRLDDAQRLCQDYLRRTEQGTFGHAQWAMRLSAVGVARARQRGDESDTVWDGARRPVRDALAGYEAQPAAPWLELQSLLVGIAQAELRALQVLSNPEDPGKLDRFESGLRSTLYELEQLDAKVEELLPSAPKLRSDVVAKDLAHSDDLLALQQAIWRYYAEGMLLRTLAYPSGSTDALAAATQAGRAAERLVEAVSSESASYETAVRMLARSKRLGAQASEAAQLLRPLVENGVASAATIAEWLLAEMKRGNNDLVRRWFDKYYEGVDQSTSLSSTPWEIDLARLEFLIEELQRETSGENPVAQQVVTNWVDKIGKGGGSYAKRRAEAIMLRSLRGQVGNGNQTLLAAQADQLVRSGTPEELRRAARLYDQASQAASSNNDDGVAFQLGGKSAACWYKSGDLLQASDQFAANSLQFPKQEQASRFYFQSILILSSKLKDLAAQDLESKNTSDVLKLLQDRLIQQMLTWPDSEQAYRARDMAVQTFAASGQYAVAAIACLRLPSDSPVMDQAIRESGNLWRSFLFTTNSVEEREAAGAFVCGLLQSILDGEAPPMQSPNAPLSPDKSIREMLLALASGVRMTSPSQQALLREEVGLLAALSLSVEALREVWIEPPQEARVGDDSPLAFAYDLRRVRCDAIDPVSLALSPPSTEDCDGILSAAVSRLHEDGVENEATRTIVGRAILRILETASEDSLAGTELQLRQADALAWTNDWQAAKARFEALASGPPRTVEPLRHGARTLVGQSDKLAVQAGIELWNRIASGVGKGTPAWHEAKLQAAEAMLRIGGRDEAVKLARYVLLISPPEDPSLKARYAQIVQQSP